MLNILMQLGAILLATIVTVMPGMAMSTSYGFVDLIFASVGGGVVPVVLGLVALVATRGKRIMPVVVTSALAGVAMSIIFVVTR